MVVTWGCGEGKTSKTFSVCLGVESVGTSLCVLNLNRVFSIYPFQIHTTAYSNVIAKSLKTLVKLFVMQETSISQLSKMMVAGQKRIIDAR